jgi:DNA invertase Pin-like site-specific DNA recombinase
MSVLPFGLAVADDDRAQWKNGHFMKIMKIGYIRISTHEQNEHLQRDALAFCDRIFFEVASGAKLDRPELDRAIGSLRKGDTLCVWRLDRMGRNTKHLLGLIDEIQAAKAHFCSLSEGFDTSTAAGRLFFTFAAGFAEFERHLIVERTRAGLIAARSRGRVGGQPTRLTDRQIKKARILRSKGMPVAEICSFFGICKTTYYTWCYQPEENR